MIFNNVTDLSDPKILAKAIREYLHLKVCPVKSSTLPELHQRVKVRVLLPMDQKLDLEGRVVRRLGSRGFLIKFRRAVDMPMLRRLAGLTAIPTDLAQRPEPEGAEVKPDLSSLPTTGAGSGRGGTVRELPPEKSWEPSVVTGPVAGELIGRVIDNRYSVIEILGQGGMGVVYEATHKYLNRKVAIKVLQKALASDEAYVARFLREAQAVAALKNRHTVTVHDFGVTEDGQLYFAMELLEGRPLTDIIEGEAPVAFDRAVGFLEQVCDSLAEAHEAGILHRDLKPDNLFISRGEDGAEFLSVLDFGIAKKVHESTDSARITDTGMILGTPHYVSPEQAHGREATPRSDIYALGVILYEMLCGHPPFDADSGVGVLLKHIQELPAPLAVAYPFLDVHPSVDDLLAVLLDKDPERRPQTARDFVRRIVETRDRINKEEEALLDEYVPEEMTDPDEDFGRPIAPTAVHDTDHDTDAVEADPESTSLGVIRGDASEVPAPGDTHKNGMDAISMVDIEDVEETRPTAVGEEFEDEPRRVAWVWIALGAAAAAAATGLLLWKPWVSLGF